MTATRLVKHTVHAASHRSHPCVEQNLTLCMVQNLTLCMVQNLTLCMVQNLTLCMVQNLTLCMVQCGVEQNLTLCMVQNLTLCMVQNLTLCMVQNLTLCMVQNLTLCMVQNLTLCMVQNLTLCMVQNLTLCMVQNLTLCKRKRKSENKSEDKSKNKNKSKSENKRKSENKSEDKSKNKNKSKSENKRKRKSEITVSSCSTQVRHESSGLPIVHHSESKSKSENKSENKSESNSESKSENKSKSESKSENKSKSESKSENKSKSESNSENKITVSSCSTQVRHESSGLPIVHHSEYVCELPSHHRFPMGKFPRVLHFLMKDQIITEKQVWVPQIASHELLSCVHTDEYLHNFTNGKTNESEQRRTGFVWSEGIVRRCRYETGGTVLAADIALQRGLACSTAGGTHHAFPSYGSGFCLLNDLAVAAKHLLGRCSRRRVLIVDLDVHQGDGTAFIFKAEPRVFTFSVHCGKNFPLRKQRSDLDISVEDGMEDEEYLSTVEDHLPSVLETFRPDLVLYDAGVDPHRDDELGRLRLTDQGLYQRDLYVMKTVVARGVPVATVIGGGYSRDVDQLAIRHSIVHRAATQTLY
ncbi:uncharacterized protein SYNPCC7002_A1628-like [Diretmus argenteus]